MLRISNRWVESISDLKFSENFFSVAVGMNTPDQLHCGVLYVNDQNQINFLHLQWHFDLANSDMQEIESQFSKYLMINSKISKEKKELVNAKIRLIAKKYLKIGLPYGFSYNDGFFERDGTVNLNGRAGLTCATFVLAILKSAKVSVIDFEKWVKANEEDLNWHERVIYYLRRSMASESHIAIVESERNCSRYRPEEVAASISFRRRPAKHRRIVKRAHYLRKKLEESAERASP